jgi:hypothetical protein
LQAWHDFFLLTGAAAATLLGLVFVAASIAATIPNDKLGDDKSRELWVLPIVWAFVRVLVVSAMGVVPDQTEWSFGCILLALAALDVGRMVGTLGRTLHVHRSVEMLTIAEWGWYVIYPALSTLMIAANGVALTLGWSFLSPLFAAGLLGHLIIGVHNAWELAAWLATRQ